MKLTSQNLVKVATRWGHVSLPALRNWLRKVLGDFKSPKLANRLHPVIGVFFTFALVWLCLDFWVLPYMRDLEGRTSLRPAQWAQLENLIKLSKTNQAQQNTIEPLDDAELQKIRTILQSKRIKPNVLRLSLENPPRIEIQASDVLFSSVVDVLEELRSTWHLYPERIEVSSTPAMAVVNISATLRQSSNPNATLNLSAIESSFKK